MARSGRTDGPLRQGLALVVSLVLVGLLSAPVLSARPAFAHAELQQSRPAPLATVDEAPLSVELDFSEPPAGRARVVVTDGCDRSVSEQVVVAGRTVTVGVQDGQPGAWTVRYRVLSDIDGHATTGTVTFTVAGSSSCAAPSTAPTTPSGAADGAAAGDDSSAGGVPLPVLVGFGAAVLLVAALVRRALR